MPLKTSNKGLTVFQNKAQ